MWSPQGRSGGTCLFCSGLSAGNAYLHKTVTAPRQGRVSMDAWIKDGIGNGPVAGQIGFALAGGASIMTGASATSTWTNHSSGSAGVAAGTAVEIRLGVENAAAGQCAAFDDISVYVRP
jgi:hypothetical protein